MKATALDHVIQTAYHNRDTMPMYLHLYRALLETKPRPYMWFDWPGQLQNAEPLPDRPIEWPHGAMCLTADRGVLAYSHAPVMFKLPHSMRFTGWLEQNAAWRLTGALVFSAKDTAFDVIGVLERPDMAVAFPEIQLHFGFTSAGKWSWQYATTGPVNHFFYDFFKQDVGDDELVALDAAVDQLGSTYSYFLGTWLKLISQPGDWRKLEPKPPRIQMKHGKIKKILRAPLLGYTQFVPKAQS